MTNNAATQGKAAGKVIRRVYLDHSATAPVDPLVLNEMLPYFSEIFGNASSAHSYGVEAHAAVDIARSRVAKMVDAAPDEIYFTGGGTESNNLAILGTAFLKQNKGGHFITSAIEHPAVLATMKHLETIGYEATFLPVDSEGLVDPDDVAKAMRKSTRLVSIMHANNEIGTVQPIGEIGKIAHEGGALFHTDAIQSASKIPLDVNKLNADFMSVTAHKMYGPKGVGMLYMKKGLSIQPLNFGGSHEKGLRPSTSNVPGIVGFGKAAELAVRRLDTDVPRVTALRERLIDGTISSIKECYLTGHRTKRLPNSASFRFRFIEGESMMLHLDMAGIAASTGSACSTKSLKASHVLLALGLPAEEVHGSLRLSLGRGNTEEDIDYFLGEMPRIVGKLRAMSPLAK
ncbi:MAG: cysteine desulfurase family protein [Methanobacteriota archaeon]